MADLLPISDRLYDLSILLVFRFDDTYEHDVLLNHHIPVEEDGRFFYIGIKNILIVRMGLFFNMGTMKCSDRVVIRLKSCINRCKI